jgi:FixJ family two-component response regulator
MTIQQRFDCQDRPATVILIEDDMALMSSLARTLRNAGLTVLPYNSAEHAITSLPESGDERDNNKDCLLIDMNLPGINGVMAASQLKAALGDIPTVFMSGLADSQEINLAWRSGAIDFLIKPFTADELIAGINNAISKGLKAGRRASDRINERVMHLYGALTNREKELLALISEGHKNQQVSEKLGITVRTVKMHRANLMKKLNVTHVSELVRIYDSCRHASP